MKKLFLALLFLFGCSSLVAPKAEVITPVPADPLEYLVAMHSDHVYCGGIWVGPHAILTAAHCAKAAGGAQAYITTRTGAEMLATVARADEAKDLALLSVVETHAYASVANVWSQGEPLAIVGHPGGSPFVFLRGTLAAELKLDDDTKLLWVSAPIWFGNSGGGAFDDAGHLVGIASKMYTGMPNVGLFVPPDDIQAFLSLSK